MSLLTLGRVDRIRLQVGFRGRPTGPAYEQFLLDLAVPETAHGIDEARILELLEPVLAAGTDVPRHYSLHQHRWHTSWGASPNSLELGLLVTCGPGARSDGIGPAVASAFEQLLAATDAGPGGSISRDEALLQARRGAAAAYGLEADTLTVAVEQHHPDANAWTVGLRGRAGEYDVLVGVVDGYAGALRVRSEPRVEVHDSVGSE